MTDALAEARALLARLADATRAADEAQAREAHTADAYRRESDARDAVKHAAPRLLATLCDRLDALAPLVVAAERYRVAEEAVRTTQAAAANAYTTTAGMLGAVRAEEAALDERAEAAEALRVAARCER